MNRVMLMARWSRATRHYVAWRWCTGKGEAECWLRAAAARRAAPRARAAAARAAAARAVAARASAARAAARAAAVSVDSKHRKPDKKFKDLREGQASGGESRVRRVWRAQGERAPPNPRARVRSATAHLQPFCNSGLSTRNTLSPTQSRRPARGLWVRVGAARAHGRWRAKWGRAEPDPRARSRGRPAHL